MKVFIAILLAFAGFTSSLEVFDPIANPIGPGPIEVPSEVNLHSERAHKQQQLNAVPGKPRIPHTVQALQYNITIHPYFPAPGVIYPPEKNFTYDGRLHFEFLALANIDSIQLDAQNIDLSEVSIFDESGAKQRLDYVTYDTKFLRYTVAPLLGFDNGKKYVIEMVYRGKINNYKDAGLFYTSFIDKQGAIHYIVATHMENGFGAKSVFPCIDDPSFKAHFQITLFYPSPSTAANYVALSNTMQQNQTYAGDGYSQVQFERTLLMSTYLVAFSTGEFVSKSAKTPDGILVRSWAWTGMEDYLQFAANTSAQCLYKMSQFADFKFPMGKTDQLGLPEFPAGAMENYGLIIYKYQYIAYNPEVHTTFNKFSAIRVMCHELSHQWFGDTVTAMWWDDLFLHEGFAAYWEYFAPLMVFPEQKTFLETYFVSDNEETAFRSDADPKLSHPIVYKDGPAFDDMTYNKGSSVLRMLKSVLGADVFRAGLRRYIAKYKFQNANHTMLFQELTTAANDAGIVDWCKRLLDVGKFLDPWVLQQNFPLVTVTHNGLYEALGQQPFSNVSTLPASTYNYTWPIPVFYQADPEVPYSRLTWIPPSNEAECQKKDSDYQYPAGTFRLNNVDTFTFARVKYDDDSFAAIVEALSQSNNISIASKVRLLNDEVVFAKQKSAAGEPHAYRNLLTLIHLIVPSNGPHPAIFETVQETINLLEGVLASQKQSALYGQFVKKTIGPLCEQLGWNTSDIWDTNIARERILPYCVRYNVKGFVKTAINYYGDLVAKCGPYNNGTDSCNPLHPDIRKAVYCAAAMQNSQTIFNQLIAFYVGQYKTDIYFYQEYQALLYGLSCSPNEKNLTVVLHHIANSKLVGATEIAYMATNPLTFTTFYDYLSNPANLQLVLKANLLDAYLNAMTFNLFDAVDAVQFFSLSGNVNSYLSDENKKTFQKYLNRVSDQVNWSETHSAAIIRWMWDNTVVVGKVPWNKRLPAGVISGPPSYSLSIQPYLPGSPDTQPSQNLTYWANSTMEFTLTSASNLLTLNAHRMIFQKITVKGADGTLLDVDLSQIQYDFDNAIITLTLPTVLPAGVKQHIDFVYTGFIFSSAHEGVDTNTFYLHGDKVKSWIFNTDFEGGPGLRSMIPCFDEPNYKAHWTITVTHEKDMTPLSNMPASTTAVPSADSGWTVTTFETTPEMSSYMVAICVGHFSSLNTVSEGGVLVRVFTWPGMEIYAETALKTAAGALDFFGRYFEVPYSLPKLDIMALPQYSGYADAMENLGLVIGQYEYILLDPEYASAKDILNCVHTVAHEVTHQWFGDMVTLEWWKYVFLNEGFAEHWFINALIATYPEQAEAIDYARYGLTRGGLQVDTNPMFWSPIVVNTSSSFDPFGPETYEKGSAMLTHISTILGDEVLRKGISNYLQAHMFGNTEIADLFDSLTAEARNYGLTDWANQPLNVFAAVDAYFYQIGYPVVKLSTSKNTVTYTQSSMVDPKELPPSAYGYTWRIPMTSASPNSSKLTWLLDQPIQRDAGKPWRIENYQGKGFYRVWYDDASWAPIVNQLISKVDLIDPITRASLLDDTYHLSQRGSVDYSRLMDLSLYLKNEKTFAAWNVFEPFANQLKRLLKFYPEYSKLLNHLTAISVPSQKLSTWEQTGNWAADELSGSLNRFACQAGAPGCLKSAADLFSNFTQRCQYSLAGTASCSNVSPDNRRTMYCSGLAQDSSKFQIVRSLYDWFVQKNRYFRRDRPNLLYALGCTTDKTNLDSLVQDALELRLDQNILQFIAENDASGNYLLNYLNNNPKIVYDSPLDLSVYVGAMTAGWSTSEQANRLVHLALDLNLNQHQREVLTDAADSVRETQNWMNQYGAPIRAWLNKHY